MKLRVEKREKEWCKRIATEQKIQGKVGKMLC
jgi:hypothetical protein